MATLSNWTENLPSDDSLVVKGPEYIREIWREINTGMSESRQWPGVGGGSDASQGELNPGASKTWVAAASASSFDVTATHRARPFFASDTSRLQTYSSNHTYIVGTPFLQEHTDYFAGGVRWVEQAGSYETFAATAGVSLDGVVVFVDATYDGIPFIFASSNSTAVRVGIVPSTGTFLSTISGSKAGSSNTILVRWSSLGTVSL